MSLKPEDVQKIAHLAKLHVDENDTQSMTTRLFRPATLTSPPRRSRDPPRSVRREEDPAEAAPGHA